MEGGGRREGGKEDRRTPTTRHHSPEEERAREGAWEAVAGRRAGGKSPCWGCSLPPPQHVRRRHARDLTSALPSALRDGPRRTASSASGELGGGVGGSSRPGTEPGLRATYGVVSGPFSSPRGGLFRVHKTNGSDICRSSNVHISFVLSFLNLQGSRQPGEVGAFSSREMRKRPGPLRRPHWRT